jgi:hypothetical protein
VKTQNPCAQVIQIAVVIFLSALDGKSKGRIAETVFNILAEANHPFSIFDHKSALNYG